MATEEVNKPSSLPDYSEMIMAAIEGLNEKEGSNKSAISNYITSTYGGDVPEEHSNLLTTHLNKLKESGELVFVKNNYMRPNADAPPKRGRGRPPKPKTASMPSDAVVSPPRPRGRPPKPKDPLSVTTAPLKKPSATPSSGRPRGRPPKSSPSTAAPSVTTGPPRGRGRPPKVKPSQVAAVGV